MVFCNRISSCWVSMAFEARVSPSKFIFGIWHSSSSAEEKSIIYTWLYTFVSIHVDETPLQFCLVLCSWPWKVAKSIYRLMEPSHSLPYKLPRCSKWGVDSVLVGSSYVYCVRPSALLFALKKVESSVWEVHMDRVAQLTAKRIMGSLIHNLVTSFVNQLRCITVI